MAEVETRKVKNVAMNNEFIKDGKYGTGLVWPRPGFVHDVPKDVAVKMTTKHPDIWRDVTDGDEGGPKDLADAMEGSEGGEPDPNAPPLPTPNFQFSEDRNEAITQAINMLDRDSPEHFGKSGKPHVDAIEFLLRHNISAEERDAVWETFPTDPVS